MQQIISATIITGADAIHPGFGFLSENSQFAKLCEECNITFIGPGSDVIEKLGNKAEARNTMIAAGFPLFRAPRIRFTMSGTGKRKRRRSAILS